MKNFHLDRLALSVIAGIVLATSLTACSASPAHPTSKPTSSEFQHPPTPLANDVVKCMKSAGWVATVDWDGSITGPSMKSDLLKQWQDSFTSCSKTTGFDSPKLTELQVKQLYTQEVTEHKCLLAANQPSDNPPSEQSYIDSFQTASQYYSSGQLLVQPYSQSKMMSVVAKCPPPHWYMNLNGLG